MKSATKDQQLPGMVRPMFIDNKFSSRLKQDYRIYTVCSVGLNPPAIGDINQ